MTSGNDCACHYVEKVRSFAFGAMPSSRAQGGEDGLDRHNRPIDDIPLSAIERMSGCLSSCHEQARMESEVRNGVDP